MFKKYASVVGSKKAIPKLAKTRRDRIIKTLDVKKQSRDNKAVIKYPRINIFLYPNFDVLLLI